MKKLPVGHFDGGANTTRGGKRTLAGPTLEDKINEVATAANFVKLTGTVAAGSATPSAVVTGLKSTDDVWAVSQKTKGVSNLHYLSYDTPVTNALPLVYAADPGAGGVIVVIVKRVLDHA